MLRACNNCKKMYNTRIYHPEYRDDRSSPMCWAESNGYCCVKCCSQVMGLYEEYGGCPELDDIVRDLLDFDGLWIGEFNGLPCFMINCGDTFAYACADCEVLKSVRDIEDLYRHCCENSKYGSTIWCLKNRNLQPIPALKEKMIQEGAWSEELEALPKNKLAK